MPRVGDGRTSLGDAAPPHSPSPPPSSSSFSSAPYVSPCECGDDAEDDGHRQSGSRAVSSTFSRTSLQKTKDEAVISSDKSTRALSPMDSFSCSATTSSTRRPSLQGAMQEQTGARKLSQSTVSGSAPSSDAAACPKGHTQTSASVAVSRGRGLHALQSPSPTLTPPRLAPSVSSPLTTSSQLTSMHAPPKPPPPPRTHYQYMHSFECRCLLSKKMLRLYGAGTVPVIVEPTESHLRLSPSPPSLHGDSKSSAGSAGSFGGYARNGQLSSSGRSGAGVTASSAASAFTSPSAKSTLKCILPRSKSVAEVILTLRGRLALDSCQSLFLSVGENDVLVPGNSLLGDLYERYRNPDGFLYLGYLLENTFGGDVRSAAVEASVHTVR
ncbi:ATG12 / APG12 [Leishmania donovani]|nr:ATG12 / APG12 [Leishmania donovani]